MSVKRIESAYAYFLDREISGSQMAVLQALAYCANEKDNEKCHPSLARLAGLTHLSSGAVDNARKALRNMQAISWVPGGQKNGLNVANTYKFLFPLVRMTTRRERYESIRQADNAGVPSSGEGYPTTCPTVPQLVRGGTPSGGEGVPHQVGSNKECNIKFNPQSNSESKTPQPIVFEFGSVLKSTNKGSAQDDPRMANESIDQIVRDRTIPTPIPAAMAVCEVSDEDNSRTFNHYGLQFFNMGCPDLMWDIVEDFWGEIKNHEHDNLKNKAAELTKRFKKALEKLRQGT